MAYDPTKNSYGSNSPAANSQPIKMLIVTPSATAFTEYAKAIQVFSSDGNNTSVTFEDADNNTITLASVPNGWVSSVMVAKVTACGGTCYRLVG